MANNYQVQFKIKPDAEFEQFIEETTLASIPELLSIREGGIHPSSLILTAIMYTCVDCMEEKNIEVYDGQPDIRHTLCFHCKYDVCPDCQVRDEKHNEYACQTCMGDKVKI